MDRKFKLVMKGKYYSQDDILARPNGEIDLIVTSEPTIAWWRRILCFLKVDWLLEPFGIYIKKWTYTVKHYE